VQLKRQRPQHVNNYSALTIDHVLVIITKA